MYGAILGDIIGSTYEFDPVKHKDFDLLPPGSSYTDDTILTVAIASAMLNHRKKNGFFQAECAYELKRFAKKFPHPMGAYGSAFKRWAGSKSFEPYYSFGNGSAMRVSPCGLAARSLTEALDLAKMSAVVTHDHPEGIKGAQATAAAIYLAKTGSTKEEIRDYIREHFYPLDRSLSQIRPGYRFDGSCQGTVPESIQAFLESDSYEDAIRNTVSLGGDADTMGAITGAIAWAYYGRDGLTPDMKDLLPSAVLPEELQQVVDEFEEYVQTL